jgi:hypothetical protein
VGAVVSAYFHHPYAVSGSTNVDYFFHLPLPFFPFPLLPSLAILDFYNKNSALSSLIPYPLSPRKRGSSKNPLLTIW